MLKLAISIDYFHRGVDEHSLFVTVKIRDFEDCITSPLENKTKTSVYQSSVSRHLTPAEIWSQMAPIFFQPGCLSVTPGFVCLPISDIWPLLARIGILSLYNNIEIGSNINKLSHIDGIRKIIDSQ